jgi:hypothetical protein
VIVGKGLILVDLATSFNIDRRSYVRSWYSRVIIYRVLEPFQGRRLDIEFPTQILTHLALHLVDLPQLKHPLPDYTPGIVRGRVSVVIDDL